MTVTFSSRLGLSLLTDDEDLSPQVPNWQRIDEAMGCVWVADGVTPATVDLFDGCIVREITSGKSWVARNDGVGGYLKKWLTFPFAMVGFSNAISVGSGAWAEYVFTNFSAVHAVNSSAANMTAGRIVIPLKGIYSGWVGAKWAVNAAGIRGCNVNFNAAAAADDVNTGSTVAANTGNTFNKAHFNQVFNAGDTISANLYQGSGGALNVDIQCFMSLVTPVL